jgi:hypothetical protein
MIDHPKTTEPENPMRPSPPAQKPGTISTEELRMQSVAPRKMLDVDETDIQEILAQQKNE